jgi:hypothetical protein
MALRSYNPHTRYKEKAAQRLASTLGIMAVIIISVLVGIWMGKQFAAEQLIKLKDETVALTQERNLLRDQVTELSAAAQTANKRYEQLQAEVESVLPAGPMQDLVTLVREQLEQGMNPERLAFVIRSARPPTGCVDPESKRFVVRTPAYKGPDSVAEIAEGAVVIYGSGLSARNDEGKPEAWYDPSKKVEIFFRVKDKTEKKKGVLPLKYSVVAEGREYRFTVESGAKSFAKVTYDSCDYP